MEYPYIREREEEQEEEEEEEEEENGVNLQTNRKSKSLLHQNISNISYSTNTSSDISVITTELSGSSSLEYSSTVSSMEDYYTTTNNNSNSINGNNNNTITDGEKPKINGVRITSVKKNYEEEEAVEALSIADENASFDETHKRDNYSNVALQNQDSNGTAARQKGVGVIEYSNNGGDKETEIGSNTDSGLKNLGILLDESSSRVNVTSSEIIYDTENSVRKIVVWNDQDEVVETSHSKDTEHEFEEYNVERVIEKQKTHEIICPNCKHCITDRVILKRRKRKTPEPDTGISLEENRPPLVEPTPEPVKAISCLSCFSIFIPNGDRFLWWRFRPETNVPQNAGGTTPKDAGLGVPRPDDDTAKRFPFWIVTCCESDREEKHQGTAPEPAQKPSRTTEPPKAEDLGDKDGLPSSTSNVDADGHTSTTSQPPEVTSRGDGAENQSPDNAKPDQNFPLWFLTCCHPSEIDKPEHPPKPDSKVPTPGIKPFSPPPHGSQVPPDVENPSFSPSKGSKDPIYEIETPPPTNGLEGPSHDLIHLSPKPSPEHHIVPIPRDPGPPPDTRPRPEGSGPDIIKAVVYGGLVECVTSLSVITSAAGGDATTLNIVALGLANVAGGLVLLLHNLRVLIHEHTAHRYEDQLGRRDHFLLHSVVAVISYLVFGLLSPIIYGFSFRLSDNKDYKLATLAAASLVCITILSIGKAYVRRQGYIQTIFYYLSVGFMLSGVGYVVGDLMNMLLKKLGVFDSSAPVAMPRLDAGFVDGISVEKSDVREVIKNPMMHDCLSCTTCNSYITKKNTSKRKAISSEPLIADYLAKRVINAQEIHDWCCSTCSSYVNKRVILHRKDISPEREALIAGSDEVSQQVDIVKAVVYGSLLQCITILSVVVSAAGADASTLNIVSLALANVFGGLLVLAHNLRALKQEQNTEHYEEQLGRPGHFLLHATVAIISYLMFGLMSPMIYGFSFYKSDNKYLKLTTLAVSSLVCITILSIGKAYVHRPPKAYMKTVLAYVSLGVMVAGPGYIAGDIANMLLEKLKVFGSSSSYDMPMIEAEFKNGAWSSY